MAVDSGRKLFCLGEHENRDDDSGQGGGEAEVPDHEPPSSLCFSRKEVKIEGTAKQGNLVLRGKEPVMFKFQWSVFSFKRTDAYGFNTSVSFSINLATAARGGACMKQAFCSLRHTRAGGNPEQIQWFSSRLPGKPDPGVFELSGPGNDGWWSYVSYMINPATFFFLGALGQKISQICRRQS